MVGSVGGDGMSELHKNKKPRKLINTKLVEY